ncbi:MAG: SDR family NAD(P)-dependent oxidoreductase [Oscillospiraceae bacterium]|nr:SDR family NAD(P)-dependent oxidoreductase [Oscillospiraceae bacterium]
MTGQKKTALITGSSRGIGRAIALGLAQDGCRVLLHCSQQRERAEAVARQIQTAGGEAGVLQADLSQPDAAIRLGQEAGPLDILVLNASVQIRCPWTQISVAMYEQQMNCNFLASLLLIQQAVPHMQEQHWGRIVTIGSVQERKPHPDMLVYSASKAAQRNMVQSLALQLAGAGITVNDVAPGVIDTDRNKEALADPVYAARVKASIPTGDWGRPEDCAALVRLLVSEAGHYITGQSLYVDGGKSIQ